MTKIELFDEIIKFMRNAPHIQSICGWRRDDGYIDVTVEEVYQPSKIDGDENK